MTITYIIAQINPTVGDISGNADRIIAAVKGLNAEENSLIIFPEMAITGYPPEDLVLRPAFRQAAMDAVERIVRETAASPTALIVGGLWMEEGRCHNSAFFIHSGEIHHRHDKVMLPNSGVFDERRLFRPGQSPVAFDYCGHRIGLLVCEDAWYPHLPRLLRAQGAETMIIINASPFEAGKQAVRQRIVSEDCKANGMSAIYVNAVGAQDDIIFDGGSFTTDKHGNITCRFPQFEESVAPVIPSISPLPGAEESMWEAAVTGLGDYVRKNGFSGVVLGLSGGIDSAVAAAMAVDALGAGQIVACMLPSPFTSEESLVDAKTCAELLGIEYHTIPIGAALEAGGGEIIPALAAMGADVTDWQSNLAIGGNMQARLRMLYLMAISNARGLMLLNTSNKSEIAVGYSTLYGDSSGGYAPLKDIYKTQIYTLAGWRNRQSPAIAERCLTKAPTAELKLKQTDQDQLPEYPVLDDILQRYIEASQSIEDIAKEGNHPRELVERVARLIRLSEYKRRQSPPGAKVSPMLFGKDWRYPLTNRWKIPPLP